MKRVLLVTDGFFHPTFLGRRVLHKSLQRSKEFSFVHVSSLEELPRDWSDFSAWVLHYHHKAISNAALEKLDQFVKNGGGILAIHAATASFKETLSYFAILGGRFIGHGPVAEFEARRVRNDIFAGIDDFVVRDELYLHELQPEVEVHFTAQLDGKEIPVVWTHRYGKGKICYAVPGHTTGSMRDKTYQQILQCGLMWVCDRET